MKIDVRVEQQKFWDIFDEKLVENGEPFSVLHEKSGETTYWGVINKKHSFVDNALSLDFLVNAQKLRVNIYVRNDLHLFSIFENHKQEIEDVVGEKLEWLNGAKSPNTRRIAYMIPVKTGYNANYEEAIDRALPVIDKMKKICEKYAKNAFFDF